MSKFYGAIGYIDDGTDTDHPDAVFERPIERMYKGDILRNSRKLDKTEELNDDVTVANKISIVADAYAISHIFAMRYVKWMNVAWKVTTVEVEPPRLILTLGGVYNGETA